MALRSLIAVPGMQFTAIQGVFRHPLRPISCNQPVFPWLCWMIISFVSKKKFCPMLLPSVVDWVFAFRICVASELGPDYGLDFVGGTRWTPPAERRFAVSRLSLRRAHCELKCELEVDGVVRFSYSFYRIPIGTASRPCLWQPEMFLGSLTTISFNPGYAMLVNVAKRNF